MSSAATKSSTTGSMPSVFSRSRLNREPMTAAALNVRLAFGSSRSMRAAMVACKRGRHTHLSNLCRRQVCARLPAQHTTLGQFAHDLLGEERITGGPLGDRLAQRANRGVRPEQLRDQCGGLRITQRRKGYRFEHRAPGQRPSYSGR